MLGQWPIVVANALTLLLASVILVMKVTVERERRRQVDQGL
jgi:uncharacterized protein with PQ loop repeat